MLKKWILIGCGLSMAVASAQDTPSASKVVVYKWSQNGIVHYSTQPPRGLDNVVKLDERGLIIRDESENLAVFNAMRPVRPDQNNVDSNQNTPAQMAEKTGEENLPEGAISKAERCANARQDIEAIRSAPPNQPITIEDAQGNLLPMSNEEKEARLESARALVERLCNE